MHRSFLASLGLPPHSWSGILKPIVPSGLPPSLACCYQFEGYGGVPWPQGLPEPRPSPHGPAVWPGLPSDLLAQSLQAGAAEASCTQLDTRAPLSREASAVLRNFPPSCSRIDSGPLLQAWDVALGPLGEPPSLPSDQRGSSKQRLHCCVPVWTPLEHLFRRGHCQGWPFSLEVLSAHMVLRLGLGFLSGLFSGRWHLLVPSFCGRIYLTLTTLRLDHFGGELTQVS